MIKKFKVTIQEKVSVWQDLHVIIEAENEEEIMKHINEGDFISHYEWEDCESGEIFFETMENIDYDYERTNLNYIEEIE